MINFKNINIEANFFVNYLSGSTGAFPYFVASGKIIIHCAPALLIGIVSSSDVKYHDFPRTAW